MGSKGHDHRRGISNRCSNIQSMPSRPKILASLEGLFGFLGIALLTLFVGAIIYRDASSRIALRNFDETQSVAIHGPNPVLMDVAENQKIDLSLWSRERIEAYREALLVTKSMPIAVLRLNKFKIRVPVFEGTDEVTLNRGAGWIVGTARPGEAGNIGIAAHRDGFFRVLKDIATGDAIELSTTRVRPHTPSTRLKSSKRTMWTYCGPGVCRLLHSRPAIRSTSWAMRPNGSSCTPL
jgi:Sortase domain